MGLSVHDLGTYPIYRPAYETLTNNVATQFLELSVNSWPAGTPAFVKHNVIAEYIQDTSIKTGIHERTLYNTRVKNLSKEGNIWRLETSTWNKTTGKATEKVWVGFVRSSGILGKLTLSPGI